MTSRTHTLSAPARAAARLRGTEIARVRRLRGWTATDLAERAGVGVVTLRTVEDGAPTVAIGIVFEVASVLGIDLLGASPQEVAGRTRRSEEMLALLPQRVRPAAPVVDADF